MASKYKLTYYPVKCLAEPSRLLMRYGGIEFEDDRFNVDDWPQIKQTMPFGQVPVLTIDGKTQYNQSLAITRYFAKKVKLVGKDDIENMEIDAVVDTINDIRIKCTEYYFEEDTPRKEFLKPKLYNELIPYYFERLNKIAEKNNGHFACNKLTWADFFFMGVIDYMCFLVEIDLIAKYPNLEAVKKNVLAIPAIQEWIKIRPKTDM